MASQRAGFSRDDQVLEAIFNPENPLGGLDLGEDGVCEGGDTVSGEAGESEEVTRAKVLEVEAVRAAEGGSLGDALEILSQAIDLAPNYPSPYNNRAQVYRLQNQIDLAVSDLNMAIQLSEGRGKVAELAHCQRGLIRRLQGLDEGALEDFKAAAKLGSRFAQKQVVAMNPYAALCNQMLSEAFGKLRRGETL